MLLLSILVKFNGGKTLCRRKRNEGVKEDNEGNRKQNI